MYDRVVLYFAIPSSKTECGLSARPSCHVRDNAVNFKLGLNQ